MIVVVTIKERNAKTGEMETIVSHGVDSVTLENIVLPNDRPADIGAVFNAEIGSFVLYEKYDTQHETAETSKSRRLSR